MAKIELVAVEGPLQGERIDLPESGSLMLGRSRRGVHLQDAQVSLEHAEITRTGGRFAITDLGSVAGTFVNGRKLGRESASISVGTTIKIGDSVFKVEEPKSSRTWIVVAVLATVFILIVMAVVGKQLAAPVTYDPKIVWEAPVPQGGGVVDPVVSFPLAFVRAEGVDHTNIAVHRFTDFDEDGAGEFWMITPTDELVVEMDKGVWSIIGRLPKGCLDLEGEGFPDVRCKSGDIWVFRNGKYRMMHPEGTTVWLDWQPPKDKDGKVPPKPIAPTPFRVGFAGQRERLIGFLQARGIEEPVHYLICEGFFPGVAAQVLTESGVVRPLDYGCIREVGFSANGDLSGENPVAVAFTGAGRVALLNDLREFLSGSPDGLFLDEVSKNKIAWLASDPNQRLGQRLEFTGAELPGAPVPMEFALEERHTLIAGTFGKAAPYAEVVTVTQSPMTIDPPGCSLLEVTVKEWYCVLTKACTPTSPAVTITQKGCGRNAVIAKVPFTGGVVGGGDENIEVRADVEQHGGSGRVDILRVRVGWREIALPEEPVTP